MAYSSSNTMYTMIQGLVWIAHMLYGTHLAVCECSLLCCICLFRIPICISTKKICISVSNENYQQQAIINWAIFIQQYNDTKACMNCPYVVWNTLGCLWTLNAVLYCVFRIPIFILTKKICISVSNFLYENHQQQAYTLSYLSSNSTIQGIVWIAHMLYCVFRMPIWI